jgi:hypothetical protein
MKYYDYSREYFKTRPVEELILRSAIRKSEFNEGFKFTKKKCVRIIGRPKPGVMTLERYGNDHTEQYLLVPETKEEFKILSEDFKDLSGELEGYQAFMDETKSDKFSLGDFTIWTAMKEIKSAKDDNALVEIIKKLSS